MDKTLREAAQAVIDEVSIDRDATDAEGVDWFWLSGETLEKLVLALAAPEWMPADILPTVTDWYMIHTENGYSLDDHYSIQRGWQGEGGDAGPNSMTGPMTHWRDFPAPPESK